MRGGGNTLDEFKQQDFMVKELSESPLTQVVGNKLKEKMTDYIVRILSRFSL
jgi:hypothetical protein